MYSGLIPGPISVDVSGRNDRCEEDLGSVIVDCGDKHYNTEVCGIPKWLMVLWIRRTARRSIVTDQRI